MWFTPLSRKLKRESASIVQEIKEREHLEWIHDFTDAFDVKEYIYIDGCHVNSRGNQIVAKRLSEMLKQLE